LPEFTQEEMNNILRTADFVGINHYTSSLVQNYASDINDVSYFADHDTLNSLDPTWSEYDQASHSFFMIRFFF
jgi:beta-glucosidase/6-phospho-beta-glucosidase/beta-galactosidase